MNESTEKAANPQTQLPPEADIRRRITEKGSQNIAKMMRIPEQEASQIIRELTYQLAGRAVV